jgi:DNA-binding transcriptional MerR regulator
MYKQNVGLVLFYHEVDYVKMIGDSLRRRGYNVTSFPLLRYQKEKNTTWSQYFINWLLEQEQRLDHAINTLVWVFSGPLTGAIFKRIHQSFPQIKHIYFCYKDNDHEPELVDMRDVLPRFNLTLTNSSLVFQKLESAKFKVKYFDHIGTVVTDQDSDLFFCENAIIFKDNTDVKDVNIIIEKYPQYACYSLTLLTAETPKNYNGILSFSNVAQITKLADIIIVVNRDLRFSPIINEIVVNQSTAKFKLYSYFPIQWINPNMYSVIDVHNITLETSLQPGTLTSKYIDTIDIIDDYCIFWEAESMFIETQCDSLGINERCEPFDPCTVRDFCETHLLLWRAFAHVDIDRQQYISLNNLNKKQITTNNQALAHWFINGHEKGLIYVSLGTIQPNEKNLNKGVFTNLDLQLLQLLSTFQNTGIWSSDIKTYIDKYDFDLFDHLVFINMYKMNIRFNLEVQQKVCVNLPDLQRQNTPLKIKESVPEPPKIKITVVNQDTFIENQKGVIQSMRFQLNPRKVRKPRKSRRHKMMYFWPNIYI